MATTYYYLKLPEDFFDKHYVKIIKRLPKGNDYLLFLLKLYVESVPHAAMLRFSDDIPYTNQMLADITDTDLDIVNEAMDYFQSVKVVEIMGDGTIWLPMADKLIGKDTDAAKRMRERRETLKNKECSDNVQKSSETLKNVQKSNTILDIDIDIDINKYSLETKEIVAYLNEKVGSNYRASARKTKELIRARLNEGFTVDDFKIVIDKKSKEWLDTDMGKYLRPETLFGTKFEGYLNQVEKTSQKSNNRFNNFDQRNYNYSDLEDKLFS